MQAFQGQPEGGRIRGDIVASVEALLKRLSEDFAVLVKKHEAERDR